ncbi:MAG: PHP domain-containing protein [Gammaproteobacteria bacterium]|nr:PHP domain-containing protein [Gammaproteobacteria bacterium]
MIMIKYDLHTHSTASDGTLTPTELVHRAKEQRVDVLALTDHDTVAGIEEAITAANAHSISLIPGVEISSQWQNTGIHIIGLDIDIQSNELLAQLQQLQTLRITRAQEMGHRLAKEGIPGAYQGALQYTREENLTRTHFARFLVAQGQAHSISSVFKHYLIQGKPGYVKTEWPILEEVVQWIKTAGGIAILAHPARYKFTASKMRRLLQDFKDQGGVGIEVAHGNGNRDETANNIKLAEQFELRASIGSDFHDPAIPWSELGRLPRLPADLPTVWDNGFQRSTAIYP